MIVLLPWVPIIAAFAVLFLPQRESLVKTISAAATGFCLALTLYFFFNFHASNPEFQFIRDFSWLPQLGIRYQAGIDGISMPLVLLNAVVSFSGTFVSFRIKDRLNKYMFFYLLLTAGLYGALTLTDLFMLYISYELTLIALFVSTGIWGSKDKAGSAMKSALYLGGGALLAFLGLLMIYHKIGLNSFSLPELQSYLQNHPLQDSFQALAAGFLLIGLGTLTSLWPLHSWLPSAYNSAPTSIAMLHGGVKIGPYLMIRLGATLIPSGLAAWADLLAILAVITILYAAYAALGQRDLKSMFGFATVSHMGYVLIAIAAMTPASLSAAVFLIFAHGLVTAASFAAAGYLYDKSAFSGILDFGGLAKKAPFLSICFILTCLASLGLPGFASFAGELLVFTGSWQRFPLAVSFAIFGLLITSIYLLRAVQSVCYGKTGINSENLKDPGCWMGRLPFILLLGTLLIFGFWPKTLFNMIQPAAVFISGGLA